MRAEALIPGESFAYVDADFPRDPLRAVVLTPADDGIVGVELHYPDLGPVQEGVSTRSLLGPWEEEPSGERWKATVGELREAEADTTWQGVQDARLALVRRQRALALRLAKVTGIRRAPASYAGKGGTGTSAHDTLLQLNWDELEALLVLAENSPGAYTPPGAS